MSMNGNIDPEVTKYQFEGLKLLAEWVKWRATVALAAMGTLIVLVGLGQLPVLHASIAFLALGSLACFLISLYADGCVLFMLPIMIYSITNHSIPSIFNHAWDDGKTKRRLGNYTHIGTWGFFLGLVLYGLAVSVAVWVKMNPKLQQ